MRWCIVAACAAGCIGSSSGDKTDATGDACTSPDIVLDVGWGHDAYTALADGDVVQMVHGPQGGWHIETAGEVTHSEREVSILPTVTAVQAGTVLSTNSQPEFKALVGYLDTNCNGTFYNTRAYLSDDGPGSPQQNICALDGVEVDLSVEVGDILSGRSTSNTVRVVLALDPADIAVCANGGIEDTGT